MAGALLGSDGLHLNPVGHHVHIPEETWLYCARPTAKPPVA